MYTQTGFLFNIMISPLLTSCLNNLLTSTSQRKVHSIKSLHKYFPPGVHQYPFQRAEEIDIVYILVDLYWGREEGGILTTVDKSVDQTERSIFKSYPNNPIQKR